MAKQDLGKIISEITSATASVDNKVGVPSVEVTLGGTQTDKEINFDFKNIKGEKGDKPVKGTDYFTEEEKQQFTTETVGLVTAEGEKQITAIGEKGTTETQKVTAEGTKQVTAVRNQGNTSLQAVNKVQGDIEALLRDQTVEGNALSLNGKTGVQYDKEIQGVAGRHDGTFPLTSAVKDGVYLVPSTGKLYVCITAYNDGQISAPNSNFEEFSVYKNRDRLDNLYGSYLSVITKDIGEEIHISRKIIAMEAYDPYMVVATRDAQGPILVGVICGGTNETNINLRGLKCLILSKTSETNVIDGTLSAPLILKSNYGVVKYNFIPLTFNSKMNLEVKIVKA